MSRESDITTAGQDAQEGAPVFVFEIRDTENRLIGWVFRKEIAMTWAREYGGTWRAIERGPYSELL